MVWVSIVTVAYLIVGLTYAHKTIKGLEKIVDSYEAGEELSESENELLDELNDVNKMIGNSVLIISVGATFFWLPIFIFDRFSK
ncbi:hypothetical protein JOC34_000598 [Virgibacillus halotolerans]|uniref:hypothetical protein n=1 Tax=Virgibacillus halotolerans TaxID=1071053 RepID=UPI0019604438|nr:hypothetical protein [Virgibacillus halotolerans]MBM7598241.1 hypothetical protein [Virgibacillus halotolerans]